MNTVEIDLATCNGCKVCYKACFADVIRWDEATKRPIVAYMEDCVRCNVCEINCPKDCIRVTPDWDMGFPPVIERGFAYRV
jgi:NAD-dependent dihydropyrimidine dehydrogenase PreA subunit